MKVAYIAGPYRGNTVNDIAENIARAREVALKYWGKGYAVFCPHMNTAFMDGACDDDDKVFIVGGAEILKRCDVIVMMKDWAKSSGARDERTFARIHDIELIYEDDAPNST